MSKEPVYRIKIEVIGEEKEGGEISEVLLEGIECSGFAILADREGGSSIVIHEVSGYDIARIMAKDGILMAASFIAKAIHDGNEHIAKEKSKKSLKNFADLLKGEHE